MKLIEAMKRLRVIEKRMTSNDNDINRYASMVSTERPLFETEEKQRQEIKALIQSNQDLMNEYLNLKDKIERTNLKIPVTIMGTQYTISSLLIIKRKLAGSMINTYKAINDRAAEQRLSRTSAVDSKTPHVVRFYDEKEKNENLRYWQDLYEEIDSRLEVINATTELI